MIAAFRMRWLSDMNVLIVSRKPPPLAVVLAPLEGVGVALDPGFPPLPATTTVVDTAAEAQLGFVAVPAVDLDGPFKQRGQPFGEVLARRSRHRPLGARRRRAGELETIAPGWRLLPWGQIHPGRIGRSAQA